MNQVFRLRSGAAFILLCLGSLVNWGCAAPGATDLGFQGHFRQLGPGMTEQEVRSIVGSPDFVAFGTVEPQTETSRHPDLAAVAAVGTPFRDWVFSRGGRRYHLYLIPDPSAPGWVLLKTRDSPGNAD